ncbi:MAG: acyl-CoA thioesterase [Nannocystaceae bacterium]|nr:acyl-CoA thioesterase [Nannocystaceae bacterium]
MSDTHADTHAEAGTPRHQITVRPAAADIDELNHVSNLVYLRWVLEVARSHSDSRGWDFPAYTQLGAIWVVRRHEIDYAHPAQLGQDITVTTWVEQWKRVSCVRRTTLVRASDNRGVCEAATTWAFVSLTDGRPTRFPDHVREAFTSPDGATGGAP